MLQKNVIYSRNFLGVHEVILEVNLWSGPLLGDSIDIPLSIRDFVADPSGFLRNMLQLLSLRKGNFSF